ncbi:MAG: hypothetical protein MJ151_02435, partial [Lachnospiraceae bacterium]|nr:hypothetical protein [Lachnospiraceae bacterium]
EYLMKLMFFTIDTYNINLKEKCDDKDYQEKACKKVLLEVRSKNEIAIKLYEKEKFVKIDTRKDYYKDPMDDCVVMGRDIKC